MHTVMIAVDGTASDRTVVRRALDLFGQSAAYIVVSISEHPAMIGATEMAYASASAFPVPFLSDFGRGIEADADIAEQRATAAAVAAGLTSADAVGEVGDPATLLVEIAQERDADVIVIGASERGWMSRLLDPSVEAAVIGRATCPVLVVHPDSD